MFKLMGKKIFTILCSNRWIRKYLQFYAQKMVLNLKSFWNLRSFWKQDITSLFRENQFSGLIEFANINFTNIIAVAAADLAPTLAIITAITVI